jgi:hypothetical protein
MSLPTNSPVSTSKNGISQTVCGTTTKEILDEHVAYETGVVIFLKNSGILR